MNGEGSIITSLASVRNGDCGRIDTNVVAAIGSGIGGEDCAVYGDGARGKKRNGSTLLGRMSMKEKRKGVSRSAFSIDRSGSTATTAHFIDTYTLKRSDRGNSTMATTRSERTKRRRVLGGLVVSRQACCRQSKVNHHARFRFIDTYPCCIKSELAYRKGDGAGVDVHSSTVISIRWYSRPPRHK